MHWIDVIILVLLGLAGARGFMKGFFVELAGMVALILGIWGGIHFNEQVAELLGIEPSKRAISFLVTVLGIMIAVHIVSRIVTKFVDVVQLGILNKLGGALLGFLSSAFLFSVLLNIAFAKKDGTWITSFVTRNETVLIEPLRAFAPLILPDVGSSKWIERAWEQVRETTEGTMEQ